ncbi:hypothetical protein G6F63_015653 [Rhizopus arrhizus]|nr:hypothetical protein G6F63_015653 [Rhizopus arrhizus]
MSGVPREIDETAYVDGYSFPRFFLTIFLPLIKSGVGVAAFFCFMFSWVELLLARIHKIDGITNTTSDIALTSYLERGPLPDTTPDAGA